MLTTVTRCYADGVDDVWRAVSGTRAERAVTAMAVVPRADGEALWGEEWEEKEPMR